MSGDAAYDAKIDAIVIDGINADLKRRRVWYGMKVRHVKSGADYKVIGHALMESSFASVVVYEGINDGKKWVRPLDEFCDGRFTGI